MDLAVFLSGPLALLGVWLGGLLSSRAQDRAWRREERRIWRDTRRIAYGSLVAAVRQYRTYVAGPHARVEVWSHPDGRRLVPGIGAEGATYQAGMEAAFAEVQILAEDQETVDRAHLLTSVARRLAVARAIHGAGSVPTEIDDGLFVAERNFVNCARRGLGLPDVGPSPVHQELAFMDTDLLEAYHDTATMPRREGCRATKSSRRSAVRDDQRVDDVSDGPLAVAVGADQLLVGLAPPSALADYRRHATLTEDFPSADTGLPDGYYFVAVQNSGQWPTLVVTQRYAPAGPGFTPGVLLVPTSRQLFIGAGTRLLSYHSRSGVWRRHWVDEAEVGFWGWRQYGDVVLMSAELELAAWTVTGDKLWTTFVEPPWSYRVTADRVLLEVMDTTTTFNINNGPRT